MTYLGGERVGQGACRNRMFTEEDGLLSSGASRWDFNGVVERGGVIAEVLDGAGEIDVDGDGLYTVAVSRFSLKYIL